MSRPLAAAGLGLGALLLSGCELGAKDSRQTGFRGAGLQQIVDRSGVAEAAALPPLPYPVPDDSGPRARETYQNVQVAGDLSTERFNHLMALMNQWVVPADAPATEQGCNYCHNPENMASDEKYTKVVARNMLQMTRTINSRWASHVKQTGVTCYTCHRGNAVPENKWARAEGAPRTGTIVGNRRGQNAPNVDVGYASLPSDVFDAYFSGRPEAVRVAANSSYPSAAHQVSIKDAEKSYGIMMHVSDALGVNCTYCHNSQAFKSWTLSRAQRATAWYGIRMVRDVNGNYIDPLAPVFPANRKGPHGDPYKVNCTTCHQGLPKPLGGRSMLSYNPGLVGPPVRIAQPVGGPAAERTVPAAFRAPESMTRRQ